MNEQKKTYKVYMSETTVHSRVIEITATSADEAVAFAEEMLDSGVIEFKDQDIDMDCGDRNIYVID